ncbi:hypothetical protein ACOYR4_13115 [Acidovorax sp. M14]|uniref:hypothetical protein n=1 Tax=Acidovorax sp. M14 TaxID=3411354 RepID=UPI003BF56C17
MKQRPLRYIAPMVRATLADTKTLTRRIVKDTALEWLERDGFTPEFVALPENGLCPYGYKGDQLWVREAWRAVAEVDHLPPRDLNPAHRIWYEADAPHQPGFGKYRPSMFMPRWASRISLEITSVRVERLQDISEADAMAEGIAYGPTCDEEGRSGGYHWGRNREDEDVWPTAVQAFRQLWIGINGPDSWAANPWVWAIEFRRLP